MKALHFFLIFFLQNIKKASLPLGVSCEELSPVKNEESSLEDSTVTLSYTYSKQATAGDQFYWYRQYPGKPPEFLISHLGTGGILKKQDSRLSVKVSDDKTRMHLQISSAAVTDSAVYYCAVRPAVTGNTKTLYKNLWSKDNTILHNIH
uniref:Immunoglobulin V-set domain-containing protein n=1 Tax=Sparus aurata TaxID=8175 RepID=A0A671U0N0_SPAAU